MLNNDKIQTPLKKQKTSGHYQDIRFMVPFAIYTKDIGILYKTLESHKLPPDYTKYTDRKGVLHLYHESETAPMIMIKKHA